MKFKYKGQDYELILLTVTGSRMYGNPRPDSDWDYRGVFVENIQNKISLNPSIEQLGGYNRDGGDLCKVLQEYGLDLEDTTDVELYELNRFTTLALANNPNILDLLCHDTKNTTYLSDKGKELLENKNLFLSKKLRDTFAGYAFGQLKKIKGHNKWINQYPDTDKLLGLLKHRAIDKVIDFNWISNNFGGQVAKKVTGENPQKNIKLLKENLFTWDEFVTECYDCIEMNVEEVNKYRTPRLIEYMKAYDLTHTPILFNKDIAEINRSTGNFNTKSVTLRKFLKEEASFRKFGESMLSIYTGGSGIFGREGNLKANDSENLGEFVCLLSVNHNEYKKDKDHIVKMWNWKCNRNEKRSGMEEKFGYDVKHASHLVRLMAACKEILQTGNYIPELSGERLKLVQEVRAGRYSYDWILHFSEEYNNELDGFKKESSLQDKPQVEEINKMITAMQTNIMIENIDIYTESIERE